MSVYMDCFGSTHVGRKRSVNEDQFLIADLTKSLRVHYTSLALDHQTRLFGNSQGKLLMVADGMGGHEAGERASTLAVDGIATYMLNTLRWYFRLDEQDDNDFQEDLQAAIEHCQKLMERETAAIPQRHGMGTTLTMAYVIWPRLYVVHVGDSRCYLLRNGRLSQLTRDHTMAQLYREAIDGPTQGKPPADGPLSHALWNVIGGDDDKITTEVYRADLKIGDSVLLCTDGLTRHVNDGVIQDRLASDASASELCEEFINLANGAGGSDNISVVVARFTDSQQNPPPLEVTEESISDPKKSSRPEPTPAGTLEDTLPLAD